MDKYTSSSVAVRAKRTTRIEVWGEFSGIKNQNKSKRTVFYKGEITISVSVTDKKWIKEIIFRYNFLKIRDSFQIRTIIITNLQNLNVNQTKYWLLLLFSHDDLLYNLMFSAGLLLTLTSSKHKIERAKFMRS